VLSGENLADTAPQRVGLTLEGSGLVGRRPVLNRCEPLGGDPSLVLVVGLIQGFPNAYSADVVRT
jgi:hypothetical protein